MTYLAGLEETLAKRKGKRKTSYTNKRHGCGLQDGAELLTETEMDTAEEERLKLKAEQLPNQN